MARRIKIKVTKKEAEAYRRKQRKQFRKRADKVRSRPKKITMGKIFRTKNGMLGCYKYVNGRRVAFVNKLERDYYRTRK